MQTEIATEVLLPPLPEGFDPFDDADEEDDDDAPIGVLADIDGLLDDAKSLPLLDRMRLTRELLAIRTALAGAPALGERIKLSRRVLEIRKELGTAAAAPASAEVALLTDIAAGRMDAEPVASLLDKIGAAIDALQAAGPLSAEAEAAADKALTKWAELEEKANG